MVTGLINDLMALAMKENDYAAVSFLQWFVNEQVEEEASVGDVLARLKMIGDNTSALYNLDMFLGGRGVDSVQETAS